MAKPKPRKRRYTYTEFSDEATRQDIQLKLAEGSPFWCFLSNVVSEIYSGSDDREHLKHDGKRELANDLLIMGDSGKEIEVRKNLE